MKTKRFCLLLVVIFVTMLLAACGAPAAAPTATSIPPTAVPPTDTPVPPTPTSVPPTPTPEELVEDSTIKESQTPAPLDPPRIEYGKITSEALAGNLLDDPAERFFSVLLPEGYNQLDKSYPVVYVLHWFTGDDTSLVSSFEREVKYADPALVQDMIYVFPNADNALGGSLFMSSPTIGDYETYITQELVDHIDASYRTLPSSESRGITGCGMGGDSAVHLAFKYPDVFSVLAPISGFYDYENNEWLQKETETIKAIPQDFSDSGMSIMAGWYIAGAAIAAPNPDKPPFYLDMPITIEDGKAEIIPEVWDKFIALDPMHEARTFQENMKELNAIMIYHGNYDPEVSADIAQDFSSLLSELGVEHDYLEVGGGHCDMDLEPVVRFLANHLVHETAEEAAEAGSPTAELDSETVDKIEMAAQIMMANDKVPGLAIGIIKDGKVVYAEGFGDANIESGIPVTSQSLFNMAQVSMMFTSAAIMQLVEQGLIDLDAPVTDYLSYFKLDDPRYTEITVRQLLDSTSGLPNTFVEKDASWKNRDYDNPDNEEGSLERFVRGLDGLALIAEPGGDDMLYSSLGYDILGDIVAKVSGQSYETYMQENILGPLSMDHSTFMLDEADADLLTAGHRGDVASPEVEVWEFFPFNMQHSPSNGLIASVDDMNKWALALLNGGELDGVRILEAESLDEIWSPSSTMGWGGLFQDYGMGWMLAEDEGHRFVWHVGGNPGFISNLILAPDDDIAVFTMVNSFREMDDGEPWYATDLGTRAMYLLLGFDYNAYNQD